MKNKLHLILKPKNDTVSLRDVSQRILKNQDLNLKDYDVSFVRTLSHFLFDYQKEVVDFIIDKGFSNFINTQTLNESVIPKGTAQPKIIDILIKYLTKVGIDHELIIVDPYFLAKPKNPKYVQLIESVLINFISAIDTIRIITTTKVDTSLLGQINTTLKVHKPSLQIIHTTTDDFHDRFWISNNREKGILIGTSLNGLGNKFSLVDRLNTPDVQEIVNELIAQRLI